MMQKYGRFEQGKVVEVFRGVGDIQAMFHPDLDWRAVADEVAVGWVDHDGQIVPQNHYTVLRAAAYPPMVDFVDGMVKVHSPDPAVSAAGDAQVAAYCEACLAVKAQYPKTGGHDE